MAEKYLVIVAGPTAVGKTDLCLQLAKVFGTEIVSADSRQFFKELSIGTAKPSLDELSQVRHHFINSHSIREVYSAGDFERDALATLQRLFAVQDVVIMTGGSGLYIKAVCEGLDDLPQPLPGIREELTRRLTEEGLAVLQREVRGIDPAFAASTEIDNPQRVVRAMEVYQSTGRPISDYQRKKTTLRPFRQILIALERDRTELYDRINRRVDAMVSAGLIREAQDVIAFRNHHALKTVGYKEVYGFLDGCYDEQEMIRLLKQNTRRYAKRQLTWFRHQGDFRWFHAEDREGVVSYITNELKKSETYP